MITYVPVFLRVTPAALAVAVLAAGCASVDLDANYNPPPVRMPAPVTLAPTPTAQPAQPSAATPQPVAPEQPVGQPLPPIGSAELGPPPAPPLAPPPAPDAPSQTPPPTNPADAPQSHLFTLTTRLEGAAVNPPTPSLATGQFDALYDASMNLLRWKASWSGLSGSITGVQFNSADIGQNGPPAMIWPGPFGPVYEGRAMLTPQQAQDLLAGRWYINVFTATYPAGEVRGQVRVVK